MATNGDLSHVESQLDRLSIASEESLNRSNLEGDTTKEDDEAIEKWGFRLKDLYRLALRFYKEKEGKAVHLSYEDKLKLVALTCQVSHGKCNQDSLPPVGVLDVIGKDRRVAWQILGSMSREEAMQGFVERLDSLCPLFKPFVEAHKRDIEERERLAREEEERRREEAEKLRLEEEAKQREEEERMKQEAQRRQVQEALNQQTYHQFKSYAEQQYPGNPEQQGVLIRQLQEQHYHQYMQQLYQQQSRQQLSPNNNNNSNHINGSMLDAASEETRLLSNGGGNTGQSHDDSEEEASQVDFPATTTASMWTRKDIKEFKESIRKEGGDAIIKVGHGETVTVRVPTHEDGTCLFWEFATDSYDIGFGVYFEWTKSTTNQVSVHISESEDEEEDDDDDSEVHRHTHSSSHHPFSSAPSPISPLSNLSSLIVGHPLLLFPELTTILTSSDTCTTSSMASLRGRSPHTELGADDIERGASGGIIGLKQSADANRPPLSVIVPVYRRDCQEEVYAGSHVYPGQGVYLLKFDNSYSLWRSKTLYYRVYYTR